jgi:hypothetical protein
MPKFGGCVVHQGSRKRECRVLYAVLVFRQGDGMSPLQTKECRFLYAVLILCLPACLMAVAAATMEVGVMERDWCELQNRRSVCLEKKVIGA